MALFRQLRLLLWKNGLVAIRQPVWSLTLIIWPLIIFIILAVTRNQFPPVQKDTCYVSPRNLPSAGFFPFLQTLMCNTDSSCNNESYLVDPAAQKTRSTQQRSSPLGSLVKGAPSFDSDFLKDINPGTLLAALKDIYGAPVQQRANNISSMNEYNTLLGDQEFLNQSQGSVNVLKRAACTMILPMINTTSSSTLNYAVAAYCQSNNTVLEVSLRTLNQILTELMVTKPDEMLKKAGVMMEAFDQLQNHPALWESLLAAPRALSSGSPDQVLGSTNDLLTHLQGALHVTKGNFSDTDAALSSLHPVLVGGINMINYIQNWPGKNVSVSLGDIIALQNDSISEVVKHVLPEVQIPLHQAIVLAWDKDMARSYVCNNGSNSVFVTAACSTGTMDILLSWISPYKVATQALLAWSKDVAPQDVAFVKGLLHSMTEGSYPGGQGASTSRARRSIDTQPQNIEEELFLSIGQVVLEIIEDVPEVDMFVQSILRTSFQVMTLAAEDLEGAEEMMVSVLKVFELLQPINRTLANESDSNVWMDYVMDEVTEIIMKSLTSESLKCEDLLVDPFEWLLNNQSIIINMWMSVICQSNYSTLQQVLLMDWPTLMQKAQEIYSNLTDQATYNVTLHMVLSEWQELKSHSLRFQALLERLTTGLGQVYWMNWTPDSGIHNATGTLLESVFLFMVNFGEKLEESQLWPKVKDYFHTIFWILSYRPNVSIHPANCSFDNHTMALHCDTGLNWPQFVQAVAQALMSPSKALVNCLNGTLNLLEYVYGDIYKYVVASNLTQEIKGEDVLSAYLNNLTRNLDGFFQMASIHPDRNTSNPHVMLPLLGYLLQPTGLTPLLPLFFSDDPINASTVIDIASNLGRSNQHIFIFNDTDPSVPELEQLLMQFFSLDGNLTLSISHIIGYSLLSYYNYFNLEDVAHLRESIQPFKNETSAGLVGILRAMELLKTVIDSQNGDPVNVTLLYIRQLQELVMSLCKFQKIKQHLLPSGQMSVAQVIGPQMLSKDFFNFLTPENLQNLTRAGPDAAQNILIQTFVAFLPAGIQQKAARFLQHFQALQYQITKCAEGQNCSDDISNIFTFLDQILDMMRSADGNASINITGINTVLGGWENEEITSTFFSLLLSPDDAAEVETFKKIFYFIRLITATQNISLSDIQTTLGKLNLTLDELNNIAALAGTDNINDLMDNIMEVINARQCFEPQNDSVMTTRCVMGFITRISRFLTHLPDFYNETDFISIIFNETFSPTQFNLSSSPSMLLIHALNSTLINIKMRLHLNQSNTHEIMEEIEVLERLIKLAASMDPFTSNFNTTLMTDPKWAQNVYQEIVEWYLKRLENITSNSSIDFIRWIMAAGNISLPDIKIFFFIRQIIATQNISLSDIQTTLGKLNLTLDELNNIAALAGTDNINDLMDNIMEVINARQCFEPQNDSVMTTRCVMGFITRISRFLTHLPDFYNETDFISIIFNETFSPTQFNLSSNPSMLLIHALNSTLINIKMRLHLNQSNTHEIMEEIEVLERLIKLAASMDPFTSNFNTTLMKDPKWAQNVYQEIVEWYLKRLENITSNSSIDFIRWIMAAGNISLSDIQNALEWSNLTLDELSKMASLAKGASTYDLMVNIKEIINARQCFEPQNDLMMTTRCVMGFITRISRFLTHLPDFYNETDFIPIIFNETFSPTQFDLSSNPSMVLIHALNSTLINIKMRLHLNQSNTHEIMEEIEVLERLIKLAASMDPFTSNFNTTLMKDPKWAQKVYQEIVEWYLKRLENITSNSSIDFIRWIMAAGNISLSDIQTALEWSNLTLDELSKIAALAKGASIYDLMVNIKEIINARKCFEPQNDLMKTTQCVIGFINGISRFLTHLPDFSNETDFLSLIPLILNETFSDVVQVNVSSNPNMFIVHLLNSTLANIKMSLQLNQMNTSEIMNEIKVLEDLMQLLDNTDPFTNSLNTTLMENPIYAQKVSIEIVEWYLKRLENITSNTSVSELLRPFFYLTQMQLTFQLAQTDFSLYVSNQIQFLIDSIPHPIDGEGVIKIGYTVVEILQHLFNITKDNPVLEPLFKTIILNTSNHHTELYLDLIEKWMEQPNVTLILTNILQWGNSSMNVSNQMTDIQQLQQTVANFLSDDQLAYLAMIGNITRSLSKVLMVAEQPGGLQSDHFLAAILEVEKSAMQLLTNATGHMPLSVQQDILEIVQYSLKLLLQPDVSFASSHNISLLILKRAENIIQQTIPGMFADYLLYGLKVATTYFEGIATAGGPEHWNDLVLNEMKTVQSILPPNSTVQAYISLLINITHFILETGQGNRSLWEGFEGVSVQNATIITEQMGKLLSILWPLGMGGPNSNTSAQSLEGFSSFVPILEQIITCQADNDTWDKLEKVLEALLSTLDETELLDNASSGMPLFEKSIGRLVNIIQAQNVMMASLQKPLVILMREIVQSVNTSHYNFSQVLPGMQHAIDSTIQAAQCNGILKCSEALNIWDPVIEAAGLSYNTMAMWCNISLQPALEASVAAQTAFSNLSMSDMGEEPMTESATAARIVKTVQSLYQVWVNETLVTEQLIMAFSNEFSELFGHRLSPEVQLYWQRKLQEMHMQTSVSSMRMLSGELRSKIPSLQPYTDAGEKALDYILNNYNLIKNGSSSEDFFRKAAMIFLTSVNISPDIFSEMWGNWSGVSESSYIEMMRGIIKLMGDLHILRDAPTVYQAMEKFLESNDTSLIMQKVVEMSSWWNSTEASRLDLVTQALPKICDTIMPLLPLLNQMGMDIPANMKLCDDLAGNMAVMLRQLVNTSGLLPPMAYEPTGGNHMVWFQQRHKGPWMPMRSPMDDFIDLFYIDYSDMFKAISVPPTREEIMETAHMFFDNPDLSVVLKGATGDMQWGFNDLQEDTIDAGLGMLAFLTLPITFQMSPMDILTNATDILPDDYSFSSLLKNITIAMATESQELLNLKQHIIQTANEIFQTNLTDPRFTEEFDHLRSQVCALENTKSAHLLMSLFSIEPGQLCNTFLPSLQFLIENRLMNMTSLADAIFDAFIGDPITYTVQATWSSVLAQSLKFNTSSLKDLNVNMTSPGTVMVGEMLRNQTAFVLDVQQYMDFNLSVLHLLMETPLPNSNKEILSWLANLHQCSSTSMNMKGSDVVIFNTFCSMSTEQWYTFSLLVARHLNLEKFTFRLLLCEELQSMMGVMLQLVQVLTDAMDKLLPSIGQLQKFLLSIEDLSLGASNEFKHKTRHRRSVTSSEATFVTLSRALCSNGITALFAISEIPSRSDSSPSSPNNQEREEIIERFKIPRNATPYCTNMFLEMVSTTGGAIAWAFLKPMLMGQILYTPDTDVTRAIMEKSNDTLHEFANLAQNSGDWIKTSGQIVKSAEILSHTLPMLQNSLSNAFVKNFIELHTDINVDRMKETIGNFSDMTMMLNQNKRVLDQISTLSNVLVNISSCIKFDRYRGYDSADQLDAAAQELAKNRELYAGVIFKLPKEDSSWNLSSSTSPLPPIVSYTIRMHMDNVIRTDRTRDSYFMKHPHMLARKTMRYNRGFVYLQENLDRAIIEIQTRQKVTEPAVQLQAFPYPCHLRDEYLDGISFNFPTMMMMAWVLFVADFVKKKVHERELRLHEYMKMMGVNPLSHFFAWFLESAAYLLMTIIILTLVLKHGRILPNSDGFILFLYFCDYGFSILAFSYLVSSFFDQTYIAGLSGSLLYILCFFPFLVVMSVEGSLNIFQKSALSLFSPTCFSYAGQYVFRYENQGEGIQWSNSYTSPLAGDTASFGWMCWLMLIDSILYFLIGVYIRMVFPGKYGIPAPWYFPFKASFWADLCCSSKPRRQVGTGLLFTNIMQQNQHLFPDDKGKDECTLSCQSGENFSTLPVGVTLHGLTKIYGDRAAIQNLNVSFYEGHVTSLLGHNGAGKTTTMSLLTGLFAPSSGTIEVYGRDMQSNIDDVRKELGVCMQYDVLFDHMTAKEHLLLYGQIKAPHWSPGQLREQIRKTLEETGMYAHRHKLVGALSGGMKRKLSISIAFIGGSRLVVLDEPTTGVDPCSRRSIWDIIIQNKKQHTIIMSTHHLDEAEVLSDRIAFLEKGGLKCCGSPFYLKEKLGQGYKLTLNKKLQMTNQQSGNIDDAELKAFVQAHVPGAQLKEVHRGDLIYSLPPFTSSNTSSYRSLLAALDSNLDSLQLEGYGISDTTLEEVFLQLTHENTEAGADDGLLSVSETLSDTGSLDSFPSDDSEGISSASDMIKLTSSTTLCGMALTWQQISAILIKRFHHSRRDWKGLLSQILLPVLFVIFAMSLGSIKNNLKNYPEMELSPALYNIGPSYSFFRNQNPNSSHLVDAMMSFPGIDNACLNKPDKTVCRISANSWSSSGNSSKGFSVCKCTPQEQICEANNFQPPHTQFPSSQIVYDLSGIDTENYLVATANDFIRNRYGGFDFGMPLPSDLQKDLKAVPKNRTLSKVWFNPEGFHTMPAYLNSLNNFILRSNLPADKDPRDYAIFVSSHPYFGRMDDEDIILQGMLHILVALCVMLGYSIMTASFAIYEVNEHHGGSKALQHIAGISEPLYWTVNFFYDMVMYMIPVTLTVAVVAAFQIPAFTDRQNLAAVTLLMVLFGFATFPWMYLLSSVFKDAEMAFIIYVCINLFISINTITSTSILYFLSQISHTNLEAIKDTLNTLNCAFKIFPQFNFGNGLIELARKDIDVQILSGYGIDAYQNPFSTESLGWMFMSSFIQGLVFFTLRLLFNRSLIRKVRRLICGRKTVSQEPCEDEDEDVVAEHLRVSSGGASSDILQVNQLTKVYQYLKTKVHAVKRLSVGIPAGECFGLLGVNGAGKTTTFKMLTGDVSPTDGTAQIRDWDGRLVDIMECRNKGINIGYCPQVDALDSLLTGREHLYFYARIRGISKREIDRLVNYLLKRLELSDYSNIITDGYSCGTRRKLSTALALIGHPQILLLDEPSSGMDPRTKRHLWKIISEEVKGKSAVVLTSHSMEECEALCSRLAIMVKGQFRCLGSLQHIKNRFGNGFTVKMYMANASCDAQAITNFMQHHFPSTYLKDQHSTMVDYHVPIAPGGVADIFDKLESNRNTLQIKHFSVSQTTLDEVFINFAMGKVGMETIPQGEDEHELGSIKAIQTKS